MGNEQTGLAEGEQINQYNADFTIEKLRQNLRQAEEYEQGLERYLAKVDKHIFKGYKWEKYDEYSSEEKQEMKSQYREALEKNAELVQNITESIKGIGGIATIAKSGFRSKAENIKLEQLGFIKQYTTKNTLAGHMKNRDVTIVETQADFKGYGNIVLKVTLRNNTNDTVRFNMKSGTVWEPEGDKCDTEQSIAHNYSDNDLYILGNQTKDFQWICSCIDQDADPPSWTDFKPTLLKQMDFEKVFIDEVDAMVDYNKKVHEGADLYEKQMEIYDRIIERKKEQFDVFYKKFTSD